MGNTVNITLSIPKEVRKRMKENSWINWSAYCTDCITEMCEHLDKMDISELFKKSIT